MLSDPEFVKATEDFVCIRIETYESEENQQRIRSLLNGSMQNTAFVVYDPSGEKELTRSSRSPYRVFGGSAADNEPVISGLAKIAAKYREKNTTQAPVLQDFDSFKQALNVAAADQRLLLEMTQPNPAASSTLASVAQAPQVSGRVHIDTLGSSDKGWNQSLGTPDGTLGFLIIEAGTFGQKGRVLQKLSFSATKAQLIEAITKQITKHAASNKRQHYGNHIHQGRRDGINYHNNMPHGEDRDGDGKIDQKVPRKRR